MNQNNNVRWVDFGKPMEQVLKPETAGRFRESGLEQLWKQQYFDFDPEQAHFFVQLGYNMAREHAERLASTSPRKDDSSMDWQEKYFDKLDRDISEMKNVVQASEDRIARMIENAMTEMRDRDNQRHQEMSEIRSNLDNMHSKIDQAVQIAHEEKKWVIGTTLAIAVSAVLAIAGMFATILLAK